MASARRGVAPQLAEQLHVSAVAPDELAFHANLIFLTVSDARVPLACVGLPLSAEHAVVHMSGVLPLSALDSAAALGARCGVLHPLQAFPHGAGSERFRGIHMGVEASDSQLQAHLSLIAQALGASVFSLQGVERGAYHAAAVFSSNYVVALQAAAARCWERAGLPAALARTALAPMTLGAASAIAQLPLAEALTGPLVRGDVASVARHLDALVSEPTTQRLYRALGRELLSLPLALEPETRAQLAALLTDPAAEVI